MEDGDTGFGGKRSDICKDSNIRARLLNRDEPAVGSKCLIWSELKLLIVCGQGD